MAILGKTNTGKTTLLAKILDRLPEITTECCPISKLLIAYSHYQPIYEEMARSIQRDNPQCNVQIYNGYPEEFFNDTEFWVAPPGTQIMIVLDDINEVKPSFEKILRGQLHHSNASLFWVSQDSSSESKIVKNSLRQIGYYILTKSSHSGILLSHLARLCFMYNPRVLHDAYHLAMTHQKNNFPYLIIDLSVSCNPKNSLKTSLFCEEDSYIFRHV